MAGPLVFLAILLLVGTLAYAGEGAWFLAVPCGIGSILSSVAAYRRLRRALHHEMRADPSEMLDALVPRRR